MRLLLSLILGCISILNVSSWSIKPYTNVGATGAYNFMFYTPTAFEASTDPEERHPLIIFLHGASLSGSNLDRVQRYGPLDAVHKGLDIPAYVLAPQCSGGWNPQRVLQTLEWVEDHYRVDSTRIYVIGMSMGGYGTLDFAASYPQRIAAAMGICGGVNKPIDPLAEIPLWILHGTADRPVPISQSKRIVERINKINKGERLIFTPLPGVNHGQPARLFYRHELYEWLLEHSLTDPLRPINRNYILNNKSISNAYRDLPGHGRNVR